MAHSLKQDPASVEQGLDTTKASGEERVEYLSEDTDAAGEPPFEWDMDIWMNLSGCWACFLASTWLLIVPSSIIGFIAAAFPEHASISIWIASSVTIANCVIQTFLGDVSDHFGRKWPLLLGMALGVAGSLVAGRASNMHMVIGGQVINGIGLTCGYLAIPLSAEIVPKNQRARVQAANGIFAGTASILGPIVAGALIKADVGGAGHGWRAAFYLSAGLAFLAFVIVAVCYNPAPRPNPDNLSVAARLSRTDWIGAFLVTGGVTLFLVGLESGGNTTPWVSARVLCCMIVGGLLILAFGAWEWKGVRNGLLAHTLFQHVNFPLILLLNFISGIVFFGGQAYLPQEIIHLFTQDAVLTGVYNIPFNAMTIGGGMIAAVALHITHEPKWIVVSSFGLLLLGNCLMLVMHPHISYAAWFFPTALLGTAVGIQTSLLIVVVSVCTPNHLIATAISVAAASRALGGSIGTVIFSQVFSSKLRGFLPESISKEVLEAGLPEESLSSLLTALLGNGGMGLSDIVGVTPAVIAAAEEGEQSAYGHAFKFVWYSLIPFVAVSLFVSFWIKTSSAHLTTQVAAGVERRRRRD